LGFDLIINYKADRGAADEAVRLAVEAAGGRGTRILTFQADIAEGADRKALVDFARSQFNRLDLLVNNAGVGPEVRRDLLEAGEDSFDQLIRVNLKGPYFLTQAIARWMTETIDSEDAEEVRSARPMIINIGSISAYAASPDRGDYCVSKAGLSMMTALFAARLAEHGINVFEVRPGITRTDLTARVTEKYDRLIAEGVTPIKRWGTPEDVGRAVAAIASGVLPFSTGEVINVDGGFHLRRL
jgi:NAD(P)-dependent dehydrogenase (short-subunit alcohol dehydrogenase family)